MNFLPSLEQAEQLRAKGQIDDNTYALIAGRQTPPPSFQAIQEAGLTPSAPKTQAVVAPPPVAAGALVEDISLATDPVVAMAAPEQQNQGVSGAQSFLNSFEMQQEAAAQGLRAAEMRGAEEAALLNKIRTDNNAAIQKERQNATEQATYMREKLDDFAVRTQDLANQKIEAKGFFESKSTLEKIVAGIGLVFSAAGRGGGNGAQIIQTAIERDLELQKANRAQKNTALSEEKNVFNKMFDVYKDEQAASSASRVAMYNNALLELQEKASTYRGAEQKANAMMAAGQIEAKKQEAMLGFQQAMQKQASLRQLSGGGPINLESLSSDQRDRFVTGYGLAASKGDSDKLKDLLGNVNKAKSAITKLQNIQNRNLKSLTPADRAEADSIARLAQSALRVPILGPGTVNDAERAILEKIVANPTEIFAIDNSVKIRLKTLMQTLDDDMDSTAAGYGLQKIGPPKIETRDRPGASK